ncbi:MAG: transglycosylase SLT domain-containing protein [bacterium]
MPATDVAANRRSHSDRREGSSDGGRRGAKKPTSALVYVLRSVALIVVLLVVIVYTVANTRPIYSTSGTLGDALRKRAPGVAAAIAPGDSSHVDQLMASTKFREEKQNFYEDIMRLKQVDSARADSIAQFAVREAYIRGISPAIIFGVMLTENAKFISKATSNVGAVGLMQVYPKIWATKEMSALLGKDIVNDSTNVKYGVFILSQYFRPKTKTGETRERDWQTALLRYNGCVKGTNTPRCHRYPNKVQKFVEGSAKSICDGRGFYECIAKPFVAGLFGSTNGTEAPAKTATVSTGSVAAPLAQPAPAPATAPKVIAPVPAPPRAEPEKASSATVSVAKAPPKEESPKTATPKKAVAKKVAAKKKAAEPRETAAKKLMLPKVPTINVVIPPA